MRRRKETRLALAIISIALGTHVASAADSEQEFIEAPRANNLGLSLAYQAPHNLNKDFTGGFGLSYTRDYFVSQRTALGVQAAPRLFPAEPLHFALGYGLTIKHYVGNFGETRSSGLYLMYGLLLQMNWLDGASGAATGHDTKMAVGYDWFSTKASPVVELGYHLTQVRAFDRRTVWWPYTEALVGVRF